MADAQERARQLLATAMHIDIDQLPSDASINTFPQWDSLNHMRVILLLEEELERQINIDELLSISDLASVAEILHANDKTI